MSPFLAIDLASRRPSSGPTTAAYRGGAGEPLVLLHGINASWRVWRPVLAALQAEHDVFAPTLPGHRGGPPLEPGPPVSVASLADGVERILDAAGIESAHLGGNSLGGWIAIELARRGRARSLVALSPAGAWTRERDLRRVIRLLEAAQMLIARRDALGLTDLMRRPRFRRLALRQAMTRGDSVPAEEVLEMMEDTAGCTMFSGFIDWIRGAEPIRSSNRPIRCPIRVGWAEKDRTIPFARYGRPLLAALSGAEHVTLPGVGHIPMYDDPALIARTILEVTGKTQKKEQDIDHLD